MSRYIKNTINGWRQGRFVDQPQYSRWTPEQKAKANYEESFLVRPSPTGNSICKCSTPEDAAWIAKRLNLAAQLDVEFNKLKSNEGLQPCSQQN